MLDDMTHASQLDSFLVKRSRANPWLHNFECRNSYSILIWERLWLEKVSDYNNSSDVETYPYQVRSFIQKTKKLKCSRNCIFFWGKNSGIHKTLNVPPLSKRYTSTHLIHKQIDRGTCLTNFDTYRGRSWRIKSIRGRTSKTKIAPGCNWTTNQIANASKAKWLRDVTGSVWFSQGSYLIGSVRGRIWRNRSCRGSYQWNKCL